MANSQILLKRSTINRLLWTIASILVLTSLAGQSTKFLAGHDTVYGLIYLFDLDGESNIPTYFSASLLLLAASLLSVITVMKRESHDPYAFQWRVLACAFLYLAVDEAAGVHELLVRPTKELLGGVTVGVFNFAWVIPGLVITVLFALAYLKFLLHFPSQVRLRLLLAATLYISGTIGMEMVGGLYEEQYGFENLTYNFIVTLEESFEMSGIIIFIQVLMTYIEANYGEVRFRFERVDKGSIGSARRAIHE